MPVEERVTVMLARAGDKHPLTYPAKIYNHMKECEKAGEVELGTLQQLEACSCRLPLNIEDAD